MARTMVRAKGAGRARRGPRGRMFGDYPVTGTAYWVWLAGIGAVFLVGLLLMLALRER